MIIEYDEIFGVKVDKRLSTEDKNKLGEQWNKWKKGINDYIGVESHTLMTRYEHFILGSGVGLPPDPFKPLALQAGGANLEMIMAERRRLMPPGKEQVHPLAANKIENFKELTGVEPGDYLCIIETPDIDANGRVRIPNVVGVCYYKDNKILALSKDVVEQLKLPNLKEGKLWGGAEIIEVFDFENGYKIEIKEK